jgi:hypothetical protein
MTANPSASEPGDNFEETHQEGRPLDPPAGLIAGLTHLVIHGRIGRVRIGAIVGVAAVAALIAAGYYVGSSNGGAAGIQGPDGFRLSAAATAGPVAAPVAMPINAGAQGKGITLAPIDGTSQTSGQTTDQSLTTSALESPQIVKTGSMVLEVGDIDQAVAKAKASIEGLGGSVSQTSSAGGPDNPFASVTYRIPVDKWDRALAGLHDLGRLISEQTDSSDVTAQVIDLDARLDNLKTTETALQTIMARATVVTDVLAVEQQLSQTEGQIEQLTAQRDHLKNQAAMSTLGVTFSLPGKTVTTEATQQWNIGGQVDEAGAALVHIGQGLATIAVWAVIVGLPVMIALILLLLVWRIARRVARRSRRNADAVA